MLWCGRSNVALDAEIHHEGRAGESSCGRSCVRPAAAQAVRHQALHRAREVGVDHDRVARLCAPAAVRTPTARRPSKRISSTGFIEADFHAQSLGDARHRGVSAAQPPIGCKTPYSYSRNERIENRLGQWNGDMPRYFDWKENARRMRGSRKKRPQVSVHRLMRTKHRQHLQQARVDEVLPAEERRFQARLHALELGAVLVEKTAETRRVAWRNRGDLLLHARDVRRRVQSRRPRRR